MCTVWNKHVLGSAWTGLDIARPVHGLGWALLGMVWTGHERD
jgi:hypothetical protein